MFYNVQKLINERSDKTQLLTYGNALLELQARENSGRGVNCVRSICFYLEKSMLKDALATLYNEWDKIRSYSSLVKFFKDNDFVPQDYV